MEKASKAIGLKTRLEVFGDRSYQDNYLLTPRSFHKALLTEVDDILPRRSLPISVRTNGAEFGLPSAVGAVIGDACQTNQPLESLSNRVNQT